MGSVPKKTWREVADVEMEILQIFNKAKTPEIDQTLGTRNPIPLEVFEAYMKNLWRLLSIFVKQYKATGKVSL